jgi:hypothetical protein
MIPTPGPDAALTPGQLRDYFAGQALAIPALGQAYHNRPDLLAAKAYEYADAMLAELSAQRERATPAEAKPGDVIGYAKIIKGAPPPPFNFDDAPTTSSPSTGDKGAPWDAMTWFGRNFAWQGSLEDYKFIAKVAQAAHAQGYTEGKKDKDGLPEAVRQDIAAALNAIGPAANILFNIAQGVSLDEQQRKICGGARLVLDASAYALRAHLAGGGV